MPVNVRFLLCLVQKQKPGVTSTKLFVDQKYLNSQKWCRPRWPMSCLSFVEHTGRSMESHTQVYGLHTGLWTKHRSMDSHTQVYGQPHTGLRTTHRSMDYTQVYGLHTGLRITWTGLRITHRSMDSHTQFLIRDENALIHMKGSSYILLPILTALIGQSWSDEHSCFTFEPPSMVATIEPTKLWFTCFLIFIGTCVSLVRPNALTGLSHQ